MKEFGRQVDIVEKPERKGRGYNPRFDIDLEDGEIFEDQLREVLCGGKKKILFECKTDRIMHRTGNLFIEYENRGKNSGLATTAADWLVYGDAGSGNKLLLMFQVAWLKKRLRTLLDESRATLKDGGDDMASKAVLVSVSDILKY